MYVATPKQMSDKIKRINRYLTNEMSFEEKVDFIHQLDNDKDLKELFLSQYNLWGKSNVYNVLNKVEVELDRAKVWKSIRRNNRAPYLIFIRYAAIVIVSLFLGATGIYLIKPDSTTSYKLNNYSYSSGPKSISTITLPDGTEVTLNANTSLDFNFGESGERLVYINGEASFNVIHNDLSEFIIDCGNLKIIDVGTVFNVKSYKNQDFIETTLLEGQVDLHLDNRKEVSMKPGQKAIYTKENRNIELIQAGKQEIIAWTKNKFYFNDASLEEVLNQIGLWYEIEVQIKGKELKKKTIYYSASRKQDLLTTLDIIQYIAGFEYTIESNNGVPQKLLIY